MHSHIQRGHLKTTMNNNKAKTSSQLPAAWTGDVKSMVADGRLTKVNVVNGKTLYALDRAKLGMVPE